MSVQRIIEVLPRLYRNFLPKFFQKTIPRETAATCADCAMCKKPGQAAYPEGIFFSRETKCCTHYPNLPNYLVGALLSDTSSALAEGRRRVRQRIKAGVSVVPHGILRPEKSTLLIKSSPRAFGKSRTLRCPFYERRAGECTIWPFRNGVCATWFCKYEAGQDGRAFWITLRKYLSSAEGNLVRYTLFKLGWEPQNIILPDGSQRPLTAEEMDGRAPDGKTYRALWRDRAGREEELYKKCYRLVAALTPSAFEKITGITQKVLLAELKARHQVLLTPGLPRRLKRNPKLQVERVGEDSYALIGYSPLDPLEVSNRVYEMLHFFDGKRSNREACRLIRQHLEAEPTDDLLTTLYQFRILVDSSG